MKNLRKMLAIAIVLAAVILSLVSCSKEEENHSEDKEPVDFGTATVYAPGDTVQIITVDQAPFAEAKSRLDKILSSKGGSYYGSLYSENKNLEILVGVEDIDGSRPIIGKAQLLLERIERDSIFEARYLIYAEAGQIAVVYDENEYTSLAPLGFVMDVFVDNVFTNDEYVALGRGVVASGIIDLIDIQEEIDAAMLSEKWANLEKTLGSETTDALRTVYSMYDDKFIGWAANLYDPGVGGFYTCRTGRNGAEFGPDVECTVQILRVIVQSGMVDNISKAYRDIIPEKMQQQMIYFAKSLQHTNGYFYHPQWGKELTDERLSRRGRDLGWGTNLLSMFGASPTYDTPNGYTGDGITADEYWDRLEADGLALGPRPYASTESPTEYDIVNGRLPGRLGDDKAEAVSLLVAATNPEDEVVDSSTAYLQNHVNFIDYLLTVAGPGMDKNPYSMGNTFNATYSQIASYSLKHGIYTYTPGDEANCSDPEVAVREMRVNTDSDPSNDMTIADIYASFSGMTLKDMTISFLNNKINPEIGLWGVTSTSNPKGTEFLFTNGFFKVITLYNQWSVAYPTEYIEMAADALMDGLLGDQPSTGNVCEVYNVWSAIGYLKSNLKYMDENILATDDKGVERKLKDIIRGKVDGILEEKSAAALLNSYEKLKGYKMPDGGFDHTYSRSGGYTTQQGMHTGFSINGQSNIDATGIASTGLTGAIYTALGVSSSEKIPLYTEADWMKMLEMFINLDPVIKYGDEESVPVDPIITFDSLYGGGLKVTTNANFAERNTWEVVEKNGDNKLFINKDGKDTSGVTYLGGVSLRLSPTYSEQNAKYMVCQFDVRLENMVAFDTQIDLNHSGKTGKSNSPLLLSIPKGRYNEDLHVTIIYEVTATDKAGNPTAFKVTQWTNNEKPTVTTELHKQANNIKNGSTALPKVSQIDAMAIALNNSFLGDAYFDNMSLHLLAELPEGFIPEGTPDVPPTPPTPDTPVTLEPDPVVEPFIDFNNNYSSSLSLTTNENYKDLNKWIVVNTSGNKELHVQKYGKDTSGTTYLGGTSLLLKVTEREADAKYMVLCFDTRFENIQAIDSQIQLHHSGVNGKANTPFLFAFPKNKLGETFRVAIVYEVTATAEDGTPTAFKAVMYVNGAEVSSTTETYYQATNILNGKTKLPKISDVDEMSIALNNSFLGDAYFDNMSLRLTKELPTYIFELPPKPAPEETEISFDKDYSSSLGVSTNANFAAMNTWEVVSVEGNNKLFINKDGEDTSGTSWNGGVVLTLNVTEKQENAKVMLCEFDFRAENVVAFASQITLDHAYGTGKANSPLFLNLPSSRRDEDLRIKIAYEVTETDSEGKPTAVKITYQINGEAPTVITTVTDKATNIISGKTRIPMPDEISHIIIALNNSFLGDAYFDNMSLKLLAELPEGVFDVAEPDEPEVPDEPVIPEIEPIISFDKDYSSALTVFTNKNFVQSNTWTVVDTEGNKELFINKDGKDTSGTTYNGGVSMTLKVTEKEENAQFMLLEFDVRFENVIAVDSQLTLDHSGKTGKAYSPFIFDFPKIADETMHCVGVYYVTETDENGEPVSFECWWLINGEVRERSTELDIQATKIKDGTVGLPAVDDIDSMIIALNNSFLGDAYFDNMSLRLVKELPENAIPKE